MNKNQKFFTLIELLVVIAIIAILASILLPALKASLDKAKGALCISNHKQINLAFSSYASDNNDHFPMNIGAPASNYWFGTNSLGDGVYLPLYSGSDRNPVFLCALNSAIFTSNSRLVRDYTAFRKIKRPEGKITLACASTDNPFWNFIFNENSPQYTSILHNGGCLTGFADGHVDFRRLRQELTVATSPFGRYMTDPGYE